MGQDRSDRRAVEDPAESGASLQRRVQQLSQALSEERMRRRSLGVEKLALERELKVLRAAEQQAGRERSEELAEVASELRRISASRSWRWGHSLVRLIRRLTLRPARRQEGAPEALAERFERRLQAGSPLGELSAGEPSHPPLVSRLVEMRVSDLERIAAAPPVSVVIPIHNAAKELRRCLASVLRNTRGHAELILIDDASTDPEVEPVLSALRGRDGIRVVRNEQNLGFTGSVNRGFEIAEGDVIILNSDTEVTPRWLQNLRFAAYSGDLVGTVTPLSDNGGAFSAPVIAERNPVPLDISLDEVGRLVTRGSDRLYPELPIGSGFCMYLRRELLDEVGGFDAKAFPGGYGSENDFCMRAGRAGWRHLVDDATIVFHERQASFGARKQALSEQSRERMNALHPDYTERIREFRSSPELRAARNNVERAFRSDPGAGSRPRLLIAVHSGGGGTPAISLDLAVALTDDYECFLLTSDTRTLALHELDGSEPVPLETTLLEPRWKVTDFSREDYREFVSSALVSYGIELVHVRNLIKHTFDLPGLAAGLGIPVVLSFHDYYLTCPTVHLLDQDLTYCEARCTPGDGECFTPSPLVRGTPPLKHRWVHTWRREVDQMLSHTEALVTTSEHARGVVEGALPVARERGLELIEHGRDLEQAEGLAEAPQPGGPIRILVPGNLNVNKGAGLIQALIEEDVEGRLEFHFAGKMLGSFEHLGTWHGPYERDRFAAVVERIRPAFIGALSITGETYSHVLTEAWAAGVPVVANEIGTFRERIGRHGGGLMLDRSDPAESYRRILALADDPDAYRELAAEANLDGIPTTAEMARRYDHLYRRILSGRRRIARVGMLLPEAAAGGYPGSTHVRCLRPLGHPAARDRLQAFPLSLDRFLGGAAEVDVALVQREAVPPERVEDLIAEVRRRECALVLELDDHLLDPGAAGAETPGEAERIGSLQALAAASELTVVSTAPLAAAVSAHASRTVVVPNMLDERLWLPPYGDPGPAERDHSALPLRALYMGTKTHAEDIELLRPAIEELRRRGIELELELIGGQPVERDENWHSRLEIPLGEGAYPRFGPWLRALGGRWQLALAPLRDTVFNRSKSDIKFLEYSALGLPGVYSSIGVYEEACAGGERGLLAGSDPSAWADACERLLREPELRSRIALAAYDYVVESRRLAVGDGAYYEALAGAEELISSSSSETFASR